MSDMWEPVGPLPAAVYWRRRATAVAVMVAVIIAAGWGVASAVTPRRTASAGTTSLAANPVVLSAPQQDPSSPAGEAPGTTDPALTTGPATATGPATPTVPATSEQLQPDETPGRAVPVAKPVPVPSTGPVPCTNAMLTVTAEVGRPAYRVGEHPVLRLVITNSSEQPCVRDLDPARQEVVVWSGDGVNRLWSSNDCSPASGADLRTMVPGQPVAFTVAWAGRTSAPGCAAPRTVVPAGAYRVMTRLDDDISAPVPLLLNPT